MIINIIETSTPICPHVMRVVTTLERPAFSLYYLDLLFVKTNERFPTLLRDQVSVIEVGGGLGLEFFVTKDGTTGDRCNYCEGA